MLKATLGSLDGLKQEILQQRRELQNAHNDDLQHQKSSFEHQIKEIERHIRDKDLEIAVLEPYRAKNDEMEIKLTDYQSLLCRTEDKLQLLEFEHRELKNKTDFSAKER